MFLNSSGLSRAMMGDYVKAYDELKLASQILIHCLGLNHIEVRLTSLIASQFLNWDL